MDEYIYQGDNYHHCIDCGLVIKYGDIVFRDRWGYRCCICQYYFEKRKINMPNIKITAEVNGKQVPLETVSTETFEAIKALEKPKKTPIARIGNYRSDLHDKRLFLKITDSIRRHAGRNDVTMIAIELENGYVSNSWTEKRLENLDALYENIRPL